MLISRGITSPPKISLSRYYFDMPLYFSYVLNYIQNIIAIAVGTVMYWAVGFGLAFGKSISGLFGSTSFFLSNLLEGDEFNWSYHVHSAIFFLSYLFVDILCSGHTVP